MLVRELQAQTWTLIIGAPFIGSFAGCLAWRLPLNRSVIAERSRCDCCSAPLGPLELVPVVSWIALKGKCRSCLAPISSVHLIAELAAAALAIWTVLVMPGWLVWPTAVLGWTLLALALMDFHHFVLSDILVLPLLALGLLVSFLISWDIGMASVLGALIGGGSALAVRMLYRLVRSRDGLGLGDVKLLTAAGAWVSWQGLPSVVFLASVSALVACLALWAFTSRAQLSLNSAQRVPFGIFLAIGLWIVWLHGPILLGSS